MQVLQMDQLEHLDLAADKVQQLLQLAPSLTTASFAGKRCGCSSCSSCSSRQKLSQDAVRSLRQE